MPAGRPSKYDYDLCKEICENVANGANIVATLKSDDRYPSWSNFRRWKQDHTELQTLYVNAIQDKSEAVLFEIDETIRDLRQKLIEPSAANVIIQTLKWKAAKFYPKMFGDKIKQEVEDVSKRPTVNIDVRGLSPEEIDRVMKGLDNSAEI